MLRPVPPDHPTAAGPFSEGERTARDVSHFGISLWWELRAVAEAAPGFVGEIVRNGVYPDRMTYRKLPWHPERADLARLRELNPT